MNRGRVGIALLGLVIVLLVTGGFFVATGGMGLARVAWYYLWREIPDKKYSWQDFSDRGAGKGISGFYAFGSANSFSMWTLSGLKTFTHTPGVSVYHHQDICGAYRQFKQNNTQEAVKAENIIVGELSAWQAMVEPENLVSVIRYGGGSPRNAIDKVWSYSGKYKILNRLEEGVCL